MTEPPKPITRAAEPIDRAGPRRPNPMADRAIVYATLAWAMAAGGFFYLFRSPRYLPFVLPTSIASCLLGVVVFFVSIVALVRAANGHLIRGRAVAALVASLLLLAAAWTVYLFRTPLAEWISGR